VRDSGLELLTCKCDYEAGLMKALRDEFTRDDDGAVDGCNFHWKQANRNKLLELRVPKELISILLGAEGLMNFFEVIEYDQIPKAIAYVRSKMDEGPFNKLFDQYWSYFLKTWMKKTTRFDDHTGLYLFSSWNISHLLDEKGRLMQNEDGIDVLVNRTNNPLERFNRKLNERIPPHPTVQVFVQIVRDICCEYVDLMQVIRKQKAGKRPKHAPVRIPLIPDDFVA